MRVVLLGAFAERSDEGLRGVSMRIADGISQQHAVLTIAARSVVDPRTIGRIIRFRPDILHYITGPTIRSLSCLSILRGLVPGVKLTIASAVRPYFNRSERALAPLFRPDLVLSQSPRWEKYFSGLGVATAFVPNGVDTNRFRPTNAETRSRLRAKYGLPQSAPVALHVGHIRSNRRLDTLAHLQRSGIQTLIVGSTAMPHDAGVQRLLTDAGCIVIHSFIEAIEEVYQIADCFVFPLIDRPITEFPTSYNEIGSIDTPLSILEAMASNLPVVTTPFGALPRMFPSVEGLYYCDGMSDQTIPVIKAAMARSRTRAPATRTAVIPFDWEEVYMAISDLYMGSEQSVFAGNPA